MSEVSTVVKQANAVDWNVVAAAVAVFFGTVITTVLGGLKARSELTKKLLPKDENGGVQLTGAILQDNQTVRDATNASVALRDQLLLMTHAVERLCKSTEDRTRVDEELLDEVRLLRTGLDNFGKKP